MLSLEGTVNLDKNLLVAFADCGIAQDLPYRIVMTFPLVQDPRPHIEGFRRNPQCLGDGLKDLRARIAHSSLDLAQIRVGDAGQLTQLSQRQPGRPTLVADEATEVVHSPLEILTHSSYRVIGMTSQVFGHGAGQET